MYLSVIPRVYSGPLTFAVGHIEGYRRVSLLFAKNPTRLKSNWPLIEIGLHSIAPSTTAIAQLFVKYRLRDYPGHLS